MATIGEDLRTWLLTDSAITDIVGSNVNQNTVPEGTTDYVWFGRATTENEDAMDDAAGTTPFRQIFDVEAISDDIDDRGTLADRIKAKHLYKGSFGAGTVQGVFVSDHADDYVWRGVSSDKGLHIAALQLEIVGYTQGA